MEEPIQIRGQSRTVAIESCSSTWVFDLERRRFSRVLKDLSLDAAGLTTEWRPFVALELDEGENCFVVRLDSDGARTLRARLHAEPCAHCHTEPDRTAQPEMEAEAVYATSA